MREDMTRVDLDYDTKPSLCVQ